MCGSFQMVCLQLGAGGGRTTGRNNRVKNVDGVPNGEIRLVPEGDYTVPLIP